MRGLDRPAIPLPPLPRPAHSVVLRLRRAVQDLLEPIRDPDDFRRAASDLADRLAAERQPWGVLEVWRAAVERAPGEHYNHLYLAIACASVGDVGAALRAAGEAHRIAPACRQTQSVLVELLFAAGREWRDYPWRKRPRVALLDARTRERCAKWLEENGRSRVLDALLQLFEGEVCLFDDQKLGLFLAGDPRFEVEAADGVKIVRLIETGLLTTIS